MVRQILMLVACVSAVAIGTAEAKAADVPADPPADAVQGALDRAAGAVTQVVAEAPRGDVPDAADAAASIADSSTPTNDEHESEAEPPAPAAQDEEGSEPAPEPTTPEDGDESEADSPSAEEPEPTAPPADESDNSADAGSENTNESSTGTQEQQGAGQNAPAAEQPSAPPSSEPAVTPPPAEGTPPPPETSPAPATPPGAVSEGGEPTDTTVVPTTGASEPAESPVSTPSTGSRPTGSRSCGRATNRPGTQRRHPETGRVPHRRPPVNAGASSRLAVAHPVAPHRTVHRPVADGRPSNAVARVKSASSGATAKQRTKTRATPTPHPRLRVDITGSRVAQAPADTASATRESWLLLAALLLGLLGISGLVYAGLPNRRDIVPLAALGARLRSKGLSDSRVAWHAVRRLRPTKGGNGGGIRYRE